jgi:hypothetical protein
VIFNMRKFKSDNSLSMKTPIKQFSINSKVDLGKIVSDLENVCNAGEVLLKNEAGNEDLVFNIES